MECEVGGLVDGTSTRTSACDANHQWPSSRGGAIHCSSSSTSSSSSSFASSSSVVVDGGGLSKPDFYAQGADQGRGGGTGVRNG